METKQWLLTTFSNSQVAIGSDIDMAIFQATIERGGEEEKERWREAGRETCR